MSGEVLGRPLALAALGLEVDVVCEAGPDDEVAVPGPGAPRRVHRIPIPHRRGGPLGYLVRYGALLAAAAAVAGWLAARRRYEAVQVDDPPDFLAFAAAVPRARAVLTRLARAVERAAVRWADHTVVVSRPCLETLRRRGLPEARISVVLSSRPRAAAGRAVTHTTRSRTLDEVARPRLGLVPVLADGYGELPLPTRLLEYAWLDLPAVCSRLPAIQGYCPPDTLACADPGDAGDVAARVGRLLRDPAAAEQQASRASLVARELGWERVRGTCLAALGVGGDRTGR